MLCAYNEIDSPMFCFGSLRRKTERPASENGEICRLEQGTDRKARHNETARMWVYVSGGAS